MTHNLRFILKFYVYPFCSPKHLSNNCIIKSMIKYFHFFYVGIIDKNYTKSRYKTMVLIFRSREKILVLSSCFIAEQNFSIYKIVFNIYCFNILIMVKCNIFIWCCSCFIKISKIIYIRNLLLSFIIQFFGALSFDYF